jgi:hypothetical protein
MTMPETQIYLTFTLRFSAFTVRLVKREYKLALEYDFANWTMHLPSLLE